MSKCKGCCRYEIESISNIDCQEWYTGSGSNNFREDERSAVTGGGPYKSAASSSRDLGCKFEVPIAVLFAPAFLVSFA